MSDELSSSEELLLGLLRDGLRDPEIAVQLGLTIAQVRIRIERLCPRVAPEELPERWRWLAAEMPGTGAELDAATPGALPPASEPAPVQQATLEQEAVEGSQGEPRERVSLLSLAGIVAALAVAAGMLGWLAGFEGLSPLPSRPAAAAAARPDGSYVALTVSGVPFRLVSSTRAEALSPSVGVLVEDRCPDDASSCDLVRAIDRVSVAPRRPLLTVVQSVSSTPGASIEGSFASGDGRHLAIIIYAPGRSPAAYVSHDGGATWGSGMRLDEFGLVPVGFMGPELLVRSPDGRFLLAPSGLPVYPSISGLPVGARNDGQVILWMARELVSADGHRIMQPHLPGEINVTWAAQRPDGSYTVGWTARIGTSQPTWIIAMLGDSGEVQSGYAGLERAPSGFIDNTHALLVADRFGRMPAVLNLDTAELAPVAGAFESFLHRDGRFVVAVVPMPNG